MGRSRRSRAGGKRKAPGSGSPAKGGRGPKGGPGDPGDGRRPPRDTGPDPADGPDFDPYNDSDLDSFSGRSFDSRDETDSNRPGGPGFGPRDDPDFDPYGDSEFDLRDKPTSDPSRGSGRRPRGKPTSDPSRGSGRRPRGKSTSDPSRGSGRRPRGKPGPRRPGPPGSSHPWLWPVVTAVVAALLLVAVFALWPRQAAPAKAETPLYSIVLVAPMGDQPIIAATRDGKPVPALESVVTPDGLRRNLEPGRYRIEWGEGHRLAFSVPEDATIVLLEGVSDQLDALLTGSAEQPTGEAAP